MKEYKSISIEAHRICDVGEKLNEYAKKGWIVRDVIQQGNFNGNLFIYLLYRDIS